MTSIHNIPDELLIHIFIIGGEDYPFFPKRTVPRHMKPFCVKFSLACQRWYNITHSSGGIHFWQTVLSLGNSSSETFDRQAWRFRTR